MSEVTPTPKRSIIVALSERYGMEPREFEITMRSTCMPADHSDPELAACLIVALEHKLNPITKEIYFMKTKGGAIQPIVSIDGWIKKCNENPFFNGIDFEDIFDPKGGLTAIKCRIHRKDRQHPIEVTEYLAECRRDSPVWTQMPGRMLRHRALIQCARIAFGFAGIMDPDEFAAWQERFEEPGSRPPPKRLAAPVEIEDIPDEPPPKPKANGAAVPVIAQVRTPTVHDDMFLDNLNAAYGGARTLDDLNEHMLSNETEIEDRGLEQKASDLYAKHKDRIYAKQVGV